MGGRNLRTQNDLKIHFKKKKNQPKSLYLSDISHFKKVLTGILGIDPACY